MVPDAGPAGPTARSRHARRGVLRWLAALAVACAGWMGGMAGGLAVGAATAQTDVRQLRIDREPDGLYLYATLRLVLPPAIEDALIKGVPMFFLAEADIVRERWYWSDKLVAQARRHLRLAYHPLTRRWRLNVASGQITSGNLGLALNLSFDSLEEAVASMQRLSGWKIAEPGTVDPDAAYKVEFRFGLDMAQLPRPFQIGALGQSDWSLSATLTQTLPPSASPTAAPAATPAPAPPRSGD